jgi:RNA polymerase sigma factor (sigma-70 family)
MMDAVSLESALVARLAEVRAYLCARCRDSDLADELAQEVAARAALRGDRLDSDGNVAGYLIRTAQNVWRDWLRRELVRRRATDLLAAGSVNPAASDAALLEQELRSSLRRAIDALPRAQREVVELRHQGDLTFQQIADRLGRPLGTVLTQMRAAMQKMQHTMRDFR